MVFSPEQTPVDESQRPVIPPVVYLPCRTPGEWGAEVEMRRTKDGRVALLAYTALDRLADCMGPHQPWILCHTDPGGRQSRFRWLVGLVV